MNDLGTKTIETERLILRKFDISDAPGMFYGWASDKNVTKYVSWNTHVDIAETLAVIENWVKRYDANSYNWVVELKDTEAKHHSTNPASGRVMEKAGMIKDAVLKERRYDAETDSYCDLVCYYIAK